MYEMVAWLDLSKKLKGHYSFELMDPTKDMFNVKYSFVLSFMFLLVPDITFEKAIKVTVKLGGNTHSNAAIVGGMIGALVGMEGLPEEQALKIMQSD
jgi:ADP-ribosylglycohydrolase